MQQVSPDGRWIWDGAQWVPNPAAPAAAYGPPWGRPYESAKFRATFLTVFLAVNMGALALGLVLDVGFIAIGGDLNNPNQGAVIAIGLIAIVFLIAYYGSYIPAVVMFCMWLHRVVRNMPALGSPDPTVSPGWRVGACFVPFLNLANPFLGVRDAWRGSEPHHRWTHLQVRKQVGTPGLLGLWWAAWLIGLFTSNAGARMTNSKDPGTVVFGAGVDLVGTLVIIAAGALAILVVRRLTARQDYKNQLIVSGQLS